MELFWLYIFMKLDIIQGVFSLLGTLLLLLGGFLWIVGVAEDLHRMCRIGKPIIIVGIIFGTLGVLTPNRADAVAIIAGYGVLEAVKTETAQRLASTSVRIIEKWLNRHLDKLPVKP